MSRLGIIALYLAAAAMQGFGWTGWFILSLLAMIALSGVDTAPHLD